MSLRTLSFLPSILALVAFAGCTEDAGKVCGTELNTQIDATIAAAAALEANATAIGAMVAEACTNIATDLGNAPADPNDVEIACAAADQAIANEIDSGSIVIEVVASPPVCTVDAQAQIDCEGGCTVEGSCDPGTIETRCEPGEFSVQCEGSCQAEASVICEAQAGASVNCEGSCSGICEGTCEGACQGECDGSSIDGGECAGTCVGTCSGSCTGSCEGSCELDADASIECDAQANVRCRGGCDGTATLPRCETELTPPSCDLDADCQASCEAEGSFNAECEPGRVEIFVDAGDATALAATLETNLPTLLAVVDGYGALWGDATVFAGEVSELYSALEDNLLCLGARLNALMGAVESASNAAANVTVTVEFSACVSASTGSDGTPACQ